jgi:ketosteroid isomerase-like protein
MSQENVEVARRAYEAFNAGDISGWLPMHSADAELHDLPTVPDAGVHRGHVEMRTWAEGILETTEYLRFEPQRFIEAGESVLVPVRASAMGRESGVPVEMSFFHVFEFSDGKIRCLRSYVDEAEALEAVGLSEQDAHGA